MSVLTLNATAKVNLYLHVTGKRIDGYHLLDSLVAFPRNAHDTLTFAPAKGFSLTVDGPYAKDLSDASNLVTKAVDLVAKELSISPDISLHLRKNIPLGSGLGGGSADAAATVLGLQRYWNTPLPNNKLQEILVSLGADVPVCYANHPCRFQGIGERISSEIPLPSLHILLIWPARPSFTKDVFAHFQSRSTLRLKDKLPPLQNKDDFLSFLKETRNDLQEAAENLCPVIKEARHFMEAQDGCLFSRMTGSGATIFGLFDSEELCSAARDKVPSMWWSQSSPL